MIKHKDVSRSVASVVFGNPVISCVRRFNILDCPEWFYFIYQPDAQQLFNAISGQYPFFDDIVILDMNGNHMIGNQTISADALLGLWEEQEPDAEQILSAASFPAGYCGKLRL